MERTAVIVVLRQGRVAWKCFEGIPVAYGSHRLGVSVQTWLNLSVEARRQLRAVKEVANEEVVED